MNKKPTTSPETKAEREDKIEKSLKAIYRDEAGSMPDLSLFERQGSRWRVIALVGGVAAVLILIASAWLGFFFFRPFHGFKGQGLSIVIEGPERLSLGQETTYFINYHNETSEPLATAEIRASFPPDFVLHTVEPRTTGDGLIWRLGSIPVEGRGTIKVRGTFIGALGTTTALQVVGTYRPASYNSDFETLTTKQIVYGDSVLQATLEVPRKALPGDQVRVRYHLENTGQETLDNMEVRFTLPDGFERDVTSSGDLLDGPVSRFSIGQFGPGASTTVVVTGRFASGFSGEAHVVAETGHQTADGVFLASQHLETSFTVLAGDLSLKLVLNGSDRDAFVSYGRALHFGVGYSNTATEELKNVVLRLRLEPVTSSTKPLPFGPVDWKTFEQSASGTRKGNMISWDKTGVTAFDHLPQGQEGNIDVSVDALPSASGTAGLAFQAVLEATIESVGDTKVMRTVRSAPLRVTYLSDMSLTSEARYFSEEGAPLGAGPLPPVVGQTTTYRVFWHVSKQYDEIKNMVVTATLPKIAAWPNKVNVSAGEVTYDANTRVVRWTLNRLPRNTQEADVDFSVDLRPTDVDAGRFASLLGEAHLEALDVDTNQNLIQTQPALTTDLQHDEGAASKGVVGKP